MNVEKPKKPLLWYCAIAFMLMMLFNAFIMPSLSSQKTENVSYDVFLSAMDKKQINKVQVDQSQIYYYLRGDETLYYTVPMDDPDLVSKLYASGATFSRVEPKETSLLVSLLIGYGIPILLFYLLWRFMSKKLTGLGAGGNFMQLGKSGAKIYAKDQTGKTFADVAGQDEAKESLMEIVDFLHAPEKYAEIGAKLPKGALLVGPPGTGKTLLAQAVAGEANVPFFSISGSEFVEMFVGMGAAKVRDLFKQAGEKAPCIVFIDEIDTIGKKRDGAGFSGNDEREQTLNQLLAEMDGFDGTKGVVILAATNRPDSLDKALLRPGRFDRRIPVELPDLAGREAVLTVHIKNVHHLDSIDLRAIAKATAGASGAELANIINEAALRAVRMGRDIVIQYDLEEAVEVILAGQQRKNAVITSQEKEIIAYHEVGHALVAANLKGAAPVHKITIIPRTSGALGYTMQVDEEEKFLMSEEDVFNKIVTFTGGRVAEELMFDLRTTGAANDIEQATRLARAMITRFGMSRDFGMVALETINNPYLSTDATLTCSSETAAKIDEEVIRVIKSAHDLAEDILRDNAYKLNLISRFLLEKETLTGEEFMDLLNGNLLQEAAANQQSQASQDSTSAEADDQSDTEPQEEASLHHETEQPEQSQQQKEADQE